MKKAGGEREEVRMEAHRIIGGEYFALWADAFVHLPWLKGGLRRQKEISF